MENDLMINRLESEKAFKSAIRKSEKALAQMTQEGSNTTLLVKRLAALQTGLAVLESLWDHRPSSCSLEDMRDARKVLSELLPSLRAHYGKTKEGSPQRTLLERRIKAMELALQAMDDSEPRTIS